MARRWFLFIRHLQPILGSQLDRRSLQSALYILLALATSLIVVAWPQRFPATAANPPGSTLMRQIDTARERQKNHFNNEALTILKPLEVQLRNQPASLEKAQVLALLGYNYKERGQYEQKSEDLGARTALEQSIAIAKQLSGADALNIQGYAQFGLAEITAIKIAQFSQTLPDPQVGPNELTFQNKVKFHQALQTEIERAIDQFAQSQMQKSPLTAPLQADLGQFRLLVNNLPQLNRSLLEFAQTQQISTLSNEIDRQLANLKLLIKIAQTSGRPLPIPKFAAILGNIQQLLAANSDWQTLQTLKQGNLALTDRLIALLPQIQTQLRSAELSQTESSKTEALALQIHFASSLKDLQSVSTSWTEINKSLQQVLAPETLFPPVIQPTQALTPKLLAPPYFSFLTTQQQTLNAAVQTSQAQAAENLLAVIRTARQSQQPTAEVWAVTTLANLYRQADRFSEACPLLQATLPQAARSRLPEVSARLYAQAARCFKFGFKDKGSDLKQALKASDAAVERMEAVRKDLLSLAQEVQYSFVEDVEDVYRANIDIRLTPVLFDALPANQQQQNLKVVLQRVEALQLAEIHNFFREPCVQGKSVQLDEFIGKENRDAALIYPIVLDDRIELIASIPGKTGLQHYPATKIAKANVMEAVKDLPQWIKNSKTDLVLSTTPTIHNWLITPLEKDLPADTTLVFILDGVLRNVPMAALYDGQKFLIDKYPIAISPGLQLFKPERMTRGQNALFAGLIDLPAQKFQQDRLLSTQDEFTRLAALGVVQGTLPNSPQPDQCDPKAAYSPLLEACFTSQNLGQALKQQAFNTIHLSTHAKFNSKLEDTYILMADGKVTIAQFSEAIKQRERFQENPIDLLFLSACETAQNDNRAILGLAGIALKSGARSTVATLIEVADATTPEFVNLFYQNLKTMPKAKALQLAQIKMRDSGELQDWAPYILVGNWL
jgi:CHAT domain-containing protein